MPGFNLGTGGDVEPSAKAELRRKHRWLFVAGFMEPGEYAFLKTAARPSIKIEEAKMAHDQETAFFAGRHTWDPITLEFYDAMNPKDISSKIYAWLNEGGATAGSPAVFNALGVVGTPQVSVNPPDKYKIDVEMQMIDGMGQPKEKWTLYNAWPKEINWGDLSYESSEIATVKVTLIFDRAVREDGGQNMF